MMERTRLQTSTRTVIGKQVKQLRADGWIPAVLFGAEVEARPIQAEERELSKALRRAGTTALIDLLVDDEKEAHVVLARDIQRDILTSRLHHVDFYQVRLDRKVKTSPYLEIVGKSPLVETGRAVLVHILNQVEVECLPADLIDSIKVDISSLESLEDSITIGDLDVPPGITILADPSDVVVSVVPPRAALEAEAEEVVAVEEAAPAEEEE